MILNYCSFHLSFPVVNRGHILLIKMHHANSWGSAGIRNLGLVSSVTQVLQLLKQSWCVLEKTYIQIEGKNTSCVLHWYSEHNVQPNIQKRVARMVGLEITSYEEKLRNLVLAIQLPQSRNTPKISIFQDLKWWNCQLMVIHLGQLHKQNQV